MAGGVGSTLGQGRYALTGVLGHGAMATVYRARDAHLGRDVAIKVLNLATASRAEAGERFRREARAAAALKHPNIVEIHDFVPASEHDLGYIVVELIDGPTVRQVLQARRGRILPEMAALMGAGVADALAVAHDQGIVHRDVKPDNIMIERAGATTRVVITDFGVAHVSGLETMTATGALVGSPAYMAPEQARDGELGAGADIWALGIALYEMTTGTLPFPGKDPLSVIAAIARGVYRRPSQVVGTVGPAFERIVVRCLAPQPDDRYRDARALAKELRALASEAGLTDEALSLRRFFDDADSFDTELRARVADLAVDRARRHVRRAELGRALAELGRAQSYVPEHASAQKLIESISARRRWLKLASAGGLAAATAALVAIAVGRVDRPDPTAPPPAGSPQPVSPRPPSLATPPPSLPQEPAFAAEPPSSPAKPPETPATPVKTRGRSGNRTMKKAPSSPAALDQEALAAATAEEPVPAPRAEAAAPNPAAGAPGEIRLGSANGFCFPTIDERPPTRPSVTYRDVPPGMHTVYCAVDKQAPKVKVGDIEVGPGARRTMKIVRGPGHDVSRPTFE